MSSRTVNILLPRRVYVLQGSQNCIEQLNVYFKNIIQGLRDDMHVEVEADYGRHYENFWRLEVGNPDSNHFNIIKGSFPLILRVKSHDGQMLADGKTIIEIVPKCTNREFHLLCIGDSMTRAAIYIQQIQETLPKAKFMGTRTYDEGNICMEGRGGWNVSMYTQNGNLNNGVSPFIFPKGIEGEIYLGNTEFWRKAAWTEAEGYNYKGFQKVARNWGTKEKSSFFDNKGYPVSPKSGDIIYDPNLGSELGLQIWKENVWQPMGRSPDWEFSFKKYMIRYKGSLGNNDPDIVSILLGANDFQMTEERNLKSELLKFLSGIEKIIECIKLYNKDINIIVNMPVLGAPQDAWGFSQGCKGSSNRYNRNIWHVNKVILERWDNCKSMERGIFICPMLAVLDPLYGFDKQLENANKYSTEQVLRYNNWVHPNASGYRQMGDALAATIQKILLLH